MPDKICTTYCRIVRSSGARGRAFVQATRFTASAGEHDGDRRRQKPRSLDERPATAGLPQHRAPARDRLAEAQTHERQRRFGEDERRHQQRRLDDQEARGRPAAGDVAATAYGWRPARAQLLRTPGRVRRRRPRGPRAPETAIRPAPSTTTIVQKTCGVVRTSGIDARSASTTYRPAARSSDPRARIQPSSTSAADETGEAANERADERARQARRRARRRATAAAPRPGARTGPARARRRRAETRAAVRPRRPREGAVARRTEAASDAARSSRVAVLEPALEPQRIDERQAQAAVGVDDVRPHRWRVDGLGELLRRACWASATGRRPQSARATPERDAGAPGA